MTGTGTLVFTFLAFFGPESNIEYSLGECVLKIMKIL